MAVGPHERVAAQQRVAADEVSLSGPRLIMSGERDRFVLCIRNQGYQASLETRKIYRVIDDSKAESKGMLRLIDDSGDDYLLPSDCFVPIQVPSEANVAFADT